MADSAQDRTLPASPRKLKKARDEGQVARSRDLGHFATLGGVIGVLAATAPTLSHWLGELLTQGLRFDAALMQRPEQMVERLGDLRNSGHDILLDTHIWFNTRYSRRREGYLYTLRCCDDRYRNVDPDRQQRSHGFVRADSR